MARNKYFLRIGSDYLDEAVPYNSKRAAIGAYRETAQELASYDQRIEAAIHIAPDMESIVEYPDYVLSLTSRGVHVEAA